MQKYVLLLIVGSMVLCGLQASATPFPNIDSNGHKWNTQSTSSVVRADVLDQQQTILDFFGPVGPCYIASGGYNYILAQSFTPSLPVLTRVELMIGKNSTTTYDYTVVIRSELYGADLATASVPAGQILTENFSWIEFDFPDLSVTPGNTYFIISSTINTTDNWYAWGLSLDNTSYLNGTIYFSVNDEFNWSEEPGGDMTFMTYGRENNPPNEPLIQGEIEGKNGVEYTYDFSTSDPDGDDVYYYIDWGDGTPVEEWIGPYTSGVVVHVKHTFEAKGTYQIKAQAKDAAGALSPWGYLEVTMPKNSGVFPPGLLAWVWEHFPNAFPLLRMILG
jgi:hypothetical protein